MELCMPGCGMHMITCSIQHSIKPYRVVRSSLAKELNSGCKQHYFLRSSCFVFALESSLAAALLSSFACNIAVDG